MSELISLVSEVVAEQVAVVRKSAAQTRDELAEAARMTGRLPESFTAASLGNLETGRRDLQGRRRREVTVDELVALSEALQVSPLRLLGEYAELFGAPARSMCDCGPQGGSLVETVRADIARLGALEGTECSLAETAYTLAGPLGDPSTLEDLKQRPALAKELRATLTALAEAVAKRQAPGRDDEGGLDDLDLGEAD